MVTRDSAAFADVSLKDVLSGESTANLDIPDDTPEEFVTLLKKCWNTNVEKRPTAALLAKKLRKMQEEMLDSSDDDSDSAWDLFWKKKKKHNEFELSLLLNNNKI